MPVKKSSDKQIVDKLGRYCAYQERCKKDVLMKLRQLGVNEEPLQEKVVKQLEKNGFLNEARYAKLFTRDKFNLNQWGKFKITLALQERNIPHEFIEKGLEEIDAVEYMDTLRSLLKKKEKELKGINDSFLKRNRLAIYLIGKGFEPELVWNEIGGN